jgi:hypothetical protein
MSIAVATSSAPARAISGTLPLWTGMIVYSAILLIGSQLLNDPDTYWQVKVGQWMIDHHAVPRVDTFSWTMRGEPWISTQWLAQVIFAKSVALAGWTGPVVLTATSAAVTFAMLAWFVGRRLALRPTIIILLAAWLLTLPHLVARPHVLAFPIMVAFVAGLVRAMDRGSVPSSWLLPLMTLWANLHGGFVLGLALIGAAALEGLLRAKPEAQLPLMLRWTAFGLAALLATCVTPYGWESLLAARRILNLGQALALIGEWRPADFGKPGPLELSVLIGFGLALWRGITLPPIRVVLVIGFVFMALGHIRNAEVMALLTPLVFAQPLGAQIGGGNRDNLPGQALVAGVLLIAASATMLLAPTFRYQPPAALAPAAAIDVLKQRGVTRVLNDYDFGGFMIAQDLAPYIDGRTELYGEPFMVAHNNFSGAANPRDMFRLLADERVEATLLRPQSAVTTLLDHMDGWTKIYADDIATIHVRQSNAKPSAEPTLRSSVVE